MKELTTQEMGQASGGWLPLVGVGLAVIGKVTASGPVGWAAGSASLIIASYQAMEHYGPQLGGAQMCYAPGHGPGG